MLSANRVLWARMSSSTCSLCRSRRRTVTGPSALDPPSHPLFPVPAPSLRIAFRTRFLDGLAQLYSKGLLDCRGTASAFKDPDVFAATMEQLKKKRWVVYIRPPFGGPEQVLRYLGRYTHRVAISNHRLVSFDGKHVPFRWRDYAHGGRRGIMKLKATEFLRRFLLHVLPKGFVASATSASSPTASANRPAPGATARADPLPLPAPRRITDPPLWHCPKCGRPMRVAQRFTAAELSARTDLDSS